MRLPRLTTRWLMVVVAFIAAWLAFVARAERLRGVAARHMRQFEQRSRQSDLGDRPRFEGGDRVDPRAAWHLKMATQYNVEADFVEAFELAILLTLLVLGVLAILRHCRQHPAAPPSE